MEGERERRGRRRGLKMMIHPDPSECCHVPPSSMPRAHVKACLPAWLCDYAPKFECDLCERSFSEKWALNNHMKLHSGEKPYKCAWPSCHYAFLNLSAMKDHYRTHTGETLKSSNLYHEPLLLYTYINTTISYQKHYTWIRQNKLWIDRWCGGRWEDTVLNNSPSIGAQAAGVTLSPNCHLERHGVVWWWWWWWGVVVLERNLTCVTCVVLREAQDMPSPNTDANIQGFAKTSNCAENIRKHILHTGKHEGVKMYNCPKCTYATNSPMEFRNHLKESHPDIENPDLAYLHAASHFELKPFSRMKAEVLCKRRKRGN
ncbi:hypothetical protein INR49_012878 [Caranx melampygus]|nr:hypothetical protein INR49_012878 [Caranx melampygus]